MLLETKILSNYHTLPHIQKCKILIIIYRYPNSIKKLWYKTNTGLHLLKEKYLYKMGRDNLINIRPFFSVHLSHHQSQIAIRQANLNPVTRLTHTPIIKWCEVQRAQAKNTSSVWTRLDYLLHNLLSILGQHNPGYLHEDSAHWVACGLMWLQEQIPKRHRVFKRDWTAFSKYCNHSKLNSQHKWGGGPIWPYNKHEILQFGMAKMFVWAPEIMRKVFETITCFISLEKWTSQKK